MRYADWIAVDWGTTRLRAWAMTDAGDVLRKAESDQGMGGLTQQEFEPALMALIGGWLSPDTVTKVVACGMVGARQGWVEAAYSATPCPPMDAAACVSPSTTDPRIQVSIIPGLCQYEPADVMRGEETQIAGLLADQPDYDGLICLPGTHSKWARVTAGQVTTFSTFMTGELFALLSERSVLRHSVGSTGKAGWEDGAFCDSVISAFRNPIEVTSQLFGVRARSLLVNEKSSVSRAALSGALIGSELAAAEIDQANITLVGDSQLGHLYQKAIFAIGVTATVAAPEAMTLNGLTAARLRLKSAE
ncbi:MAG: 2-dehydro-3-deoxygalactonokinase [Pikeienuella sp.]